MYNNKLHIMSWMILFKKQLFDLEVKGHGPTKDITMRDTPPYGHASTCKYHWPISKDKNVMAQTGQYYLKTISWPWGQRSRSHVGHYHTWHIALWSCTHIPNIIDLSGKTKKLWFGQASLRRSRSRRSGSGSRRKNQTKTVCLPLFEGET